MSKQKSFTFESVYPMCEQWIKNKHYRYLVNHQNDGTPAITDWQEYYKTFKSFLDNRYKEEQL